MGGAAVLRFVIRDTDPDGKGLRMPFNEDPNEDLGTQIVSATITC